MEQHDKAAEEASGQEGVQVHFATKSVGHCYFVTGVLGLCKQCWYEIKAFQRAAD